MAATRVHLGADAWALLVGALEGAPLPPPFRAQDCPTLDAAMRAAAERALRDARLLAGDSGDLLGDLEPRLRESLLAHARPSVIVDSSAGLGEALRSAHHVLRGDVASGLVRSQRPVGADEIELGPIELSMLRCADVVDEVLRGFGVLEGDPGRLPAPLPAAVARALAGDRPDVARAAAESLTLPPPLHVPGLRSVVRVDVARAAGRFALVALRAGGGWWRVVAADEGATLRPSGAGDLAAALTAALGD